tara:strand:- start:337 stop:564 length:228 start_codon:yes stop_codon:yes gene_type:complete
MSLSLTFIIPHTIRSVRTRAVTDPAQYDVEVNAARGFKSPQKGKSSTIRVENGVTYDPDQFDTEENIKRHILNPK